jgi:hypothetical protein
MSKLWMMGAAVIAVSVAVVAWGGRPVRTSDDLLGKAQAEFAIKARDALIQRQMVQVSTASVALTAPKSAPLSPGVVASLEPVAAPAPAAAPEAPLEVAAPEALTVTVASLEAPAVSRDIVGSPASVPALAPVVAPATEDAPAAKPQLASLPEAPRVSVAPKQIAPEAPKDIAAVAPLSEIAKADEPAVTRNSVAPGRRFKAEGKTRHVQRERKTNAAVYRSEGRAPRYATPYNLESLRARAPEIAAAIARYM